jgi:hypothetical protein
MKMGYETEIHLPAEWGQPAATARKRTALRSSYAMYS